MGAKTRTGGELSKKDARRANTPPITCVDDHTNADMAPRVGRLLAVVHDSPPPSRNGPKAPGGGGGGHWRGGSGRGDGGGGGREGR